MESLLLTALEPLVSVNFANRKINYITKREDENLPFFLFIF